jgi:hypothetical protein
MTTRSQLLILLLLIVSIAQCSGETTLSKDVKFMSRSDEPIVINGDITLGSGDEEVKIKAPWFLWNYSFQNNSAMRVVVPTAIFKLSTRLNGIKQTKEAIIDPGQFCSSLETRSYLAIVEPADGTASNLDEFSGLRINTCDLTNTANWLSPANGQYENWYLYDLGKSDTGIWTVEVEAVGWFEDPNNNNEIVERYNGYDYLITR